MKKLLYLILLFFALSGSTQVLQAQYYQTPVLEGKYKYPDGRGYIEFTGDQYGYQHYVREEYDGRIYFGTYYFLPEINFTPRYGSSGKGQLTITWWCGSNVETSVAGVGGRIIWISVSHLGNDQDMQLTRIGSCTLTNQDIISQQNGTHPTYYNQTKPLSNGTGLGASYAGKWKRKDGKGSLELSPEGVMRFTIDGKTRIGKFDYWSPYKSLGDQYGSIFFYWRDTGDEKCFVTQLTNNSLIIEDSKSVNEYEYESPKVILKKEADAIALSGKTDKSIPPAKVKQSVSTGQSLVGKWQQVDGNEILEFSDDTYFRTSSKSSTDKNYGTYTREWNNGRVRLHFYGQDSPVSVEIRSISATELILESGTTLPSRYKAAGKTNLNRTAVRTALGDDLDGQGGEGEHLCASPLICHTCSGDGSIKCNRCYGEGSIQETYWEYDYNQGRDVQRTRTITCPQCSGDGCEACDDFTCIRRKSISAHSEYILRPALNPCRKFGTGTAYYLVPNGNGGYKIIWH